MAITKPATPIEVKRKRGTLRKDRTPVVLTAVAPADVTVVEAMGPVGQAFLDAGAAAWLSATDQVGLLRLIDNGWSEYESLRARWIASDYSNAQVAKRLGDVEANLTKWLSLAGLTPSDRSRLGLAEVKARSKLEELRSKAGRQPS